MITAIALSAALSMCQPIAEFAHEVMVARQAGVPLAEALTVTRQPTMQALIISAYRKPRYSTQDYREREVTEFANAILITCLEGVEK